MKTIKLNNEQLRKLFLNGILESNVLISEEVIMDFNNTYDENIKIIVED